MGAPRCRFPRVCHLRKDRHRLHGGSRRHRAGAFHARQRFLEVETGLGDGCHHGHACFIVLCSSQSRTFHRIFLRMDRRVDEAHHQHRFLYQVAGIPRHALRVDGGLPRHRRRAHRSRADAMAVGQFVDRLPAVRVDVAVPDVHAQLLPHSTHPADCAWTGCGVEPAHRICLKHWRGWTRRFHHLGGRRHRISSLRRAFRPRRGRFSS